MTSIEPGDTLGQLAATVIRGCAGSLRLPGWMCEWGVGDDEQRAFLRTLGATLYGLGQRDGAQMLTEELQRQAETWEAFSAASEKVVPRASSTHDAYHWDGRAVAYGNVAQELRTRHAEVTGAVEPRARAQVQPGPVLAAGARLTGLDQNGEPAGPVVVMGESR